MEPSRRALTGERVLAAAVLAAALAAAWLQTRSPLAARARDGKPWLAWVEARPAGPARVPSFLLLVYEPVGRRLSLVHVPNDTRLEGRRTLERAYLDALKATGDPASAARAAEDLAAVRLSAMAAEPFAAPSARFVLLVDEPSPEDEPAVEAARALKGSSRDRRAWTAALRRAATGLRAGLPDALDPLFLGLELRRVPVERLEPARLPDESRAAGLLASLMTPTPSEEPPAVVTAEVLNAADDPGLASRAAKMLRFKGVDVLTLGTARPRRRTMVYDRVGDYSRAARTLAALGCPSGRAMTRVDPSRVVDVSVELGADCAARFGRD